MKIPTALGVACGCLLALNAAASELSYTFLEFGSITADSELTGTQSAGLQTVTLVPGDGDGDGLMINGSLAVANRFYLRASYRAVVIDTLARVESPLVVAEVAGSFDWTATGAFFGAVVPIGDRFDLIAEVGQRSVDLDFGSFAGENFDTSASASEFTVGFRFNPAERFELALRGYLSEAGEVDLATRSFESGAGVVAAARWYVFEDIGFGLEARSGDIRSISASIRFGFGELRAGD